ncbi:MAG TPA: YihY/virulence factor BrkB family protein [Chloroflexota bacterium]
MILVDRVRAVYQRFERTTLGQFVTKVVNDDVATLASAIAYTMMFAVFPLLLALLAVLGLVLGDPDQREVALTQIRRFLPPQAVEEVRPVLETATVQANLFGVVALLGLLWAGSALFRGLSMGLNHVHGVPMRGPVAQALVTLGLTVALVALFPLAVLGSTLATYLLTLPAGLPIDAVPAVVWSIAGWVISWLLTFALVLAILWVLPNTTMHLRDVVPGVTLSTTLIFLLTQVFPLYTRLSGEFSRFGATLGLAFILLTWFYLFSFAILLGGEVNAFRMGRREGHALDRHDVPSAPAERQAPSPPRS